MSHESPPSFESLGLAQPLLRALQELGYENESHVLFNADVVG